jgi:hypothetical protein
LLLVLLVLQQHHPAPAAAPAACNKLLQAVRLLLVLLLVLLLKQLTRGLSLKGCLFLPLHSTLAMLPASMVLLESATAACCVKAPSVR